MPTVRYTVLDGEIIAEKRDGVRRTYVPEAIGSTVALLDSSQTQTDTFTYWPYGEEKTRTGAINTPFRYGGTFGYHRDESHRAYVRARTLNVHFGMWATPEYVGVARSDSNAYRYVMNSPVTWLDPSGLAPKGSPQYCAEQLAKMERCRKLFQNEMRKYDPFEDSIGGCPKKGGVTKPYGHYIEMISYQTCIRNAWANLWLYCRPWISARRLPSEATEPIPIRIRFPAHDPSQYISRESQRVWQIYPDYRPSLEQCLTAGGEVIIGIIFIIIFKGRCRSMGAPITVGAGA